MSEKALLARFDLVVDNPENIPLLRHYIVDLAIRGKLLEKSALDISALEMLKRIDAKADSLVKQGKLKKQKPLAPISAEELPATYIAHCTFERLGNVANLQKGLTGIQSAMPGKFPLVVTAAARSTCDHFDCDGAAAIIPMVSSTGHGHASLNRLHYQEGKFALGTILCAVFPIAEELVSARFLFEYLTAFKDDLLVSKMNGTANVTLTVGKIAEVPVPIIAPAVQRRVNELMALCDQLQAAQNEREARRDRLVAASLHRIGTAPATADEAETGSIPLPEAARFHLTHLPRLTTRSEHIKQLRQTILNLAVRGRLIPQDPNDEPAAELFKRIAGKKMANGRTAQKSEESRSEGMPSGWVTVDLSDYALEVCTGPFGSALHQSDYINGGIPLVNPSHMINDRIVSEVSVSVPTDIAERLSSYRLEPGDIVMARRGEVGRAALVEHNQKGWLCGTGSFYLRFSQEINRYFFLLLLRSTQIRSYLTGKAVGTTMVNLNHSILNKARLEIPPLAEQHRIVAKVDELMALCDQLEAQHTTNQTDSRRLLEAVLHEALAA